MAMQTPVAGADLLPVHPQLVSAREVAEVHADGFLEEVSLVLGEEAVVDLDPGAVPGDAVGPRGFGGLARTRNLDRAPLGGLPRRRCDEERAGKEQERAGWGHRRFSFSASPILKDLLL